MKRTVNQSGYKTLFIQHVIHRFFLQFIMY